jgi:hypothetical protein
MIDETSTNPMERNAIPDVTAAQHFRLPGDCAA